MDQKAQATQIERRQQIEQTLRQLICEGIGPGITPEKIDPDLPLEDQGLDSFQFMELLVEIEDTFKVMVSEEDLATREMDSLNDLTNLIEALSAEVSTD